MCDRLQQPIINADNEDDDPSLHAKKSAKWEQSQQMLSQSGCMDASKLLELCLQSNDRQWGRCKEQI